MSRKKLLRENLRKWNFWRKEYSSEISEKLIYVAGAMKVVGSMVEGLGFLREVVWW